MRFIDTNIFTRFLTADDVEKGNACKRLFQRLALSEEEAMTSEAVIAEVFFVLTSPRQYAVERLDAVARVEPLLLADGLKLSEKHSILRAMQLYTRHSFLDFEDALSVAHMEREQIEEILSYDRGFDRVEEVGRVEPQLA